VAMADVSTAGCRMCCCGIVDVVSICEGNESGFGGACSEVSTNMV